ncbi:SNF2 family N-terminal domain-containing protein, partial [Lipomyces oligophaga]|uniref:SNF2 family N-terminal domain-containing protein n=1 Tax=Lipomyces oligophaga TaxID=45792 RepID=UPI0034CE70C7
MLTFEQADLAINQRERDLDTKRLEKLLSQKVKLFEKCAKLEDRLSNPGITISTRAKIIDDIEQIRTIELGPIEQDILDIKSRLDERDRAIDAIGASVDSSQRLPDETERDFLIRTGKITPFSNMMGLERTSGSQRQTELEITDNSATMSHQKLRVPGMEFDINAESGEGETIKSEEENVSTNIRSNSKRKRMHIENNSVLSRRRKASPDQSEDDLYVKEEPDSGSDFAADIEVDSESEMDVEDYASDELSRKSKSKTKKLQAEQVEELGEQDDGDESYYVKRLRQWSDKRSAFRRKVQLTNDEDDEEEAEWFRPHPKIKDMVFEGSYRLPGDIHASLFDYQKTCVQWLWELYSQKTGGIIGDEMGLGKTIQIISFIAGLHYSGKLTEPVLIVCPATVMKQWVNELHRWWPPFRCVILHSSGSGMLKGADDLEELDMTLSRNRGKLENSKSSKAVHRLVTRVVRKGHVLITTYVGMQIYRDAIIPNKWGYCVLDEGHKIRNPDSDISLVCKRVKTPHRIILSGTPMQNNLNELWSLFDFVCPGRLGTLPLFQHEFAVPIKVGGYANATNIQVQTAYKCACVLRDLISPYLLRRMKVDVAADLPKKTEQVLFCKLTKPQHDAYVQFLKSGDMRSILSGKRQVLFGVDILRKICNHPDLIGRELLQHKEGYKYGSANKSGKMQVVKSLILLWKKQSHRCLLFCQTRQMLDILEIFVKSLETITYLRMDGSTAIGARQELVDEFNNNTDINIFLLTTRVGGLGINLTGADRVIIFDPDWNPSTDVQARERAWRLGQRKEVAIYRLMTSGTIEEKIYHRQIFKQFLTNKILKDPRQRRFFKNSDLHDLFSLGDQTAEGTETGSLFSGAEVQLKEKLERVNFRRKNKEAEKVRSLEGVASLEKYHDGSDEDRETQHAGRDEVTEDDQAVMEGLFARSGVHSALEHDEIMNSSRPDAVLVDREASRIANEAAQALRESRRATRHAALGTPTWTGKYGRAGRDTDMLRIGAPLQSETRSSRSSR